MGEIFNTINSLIELKTAGGLIAMWGLAVYALVKIATFLGVCAAEGAINKALTKMMPLVKSQFKIEFESIKEDVMQLKQEVTELKSSVESYRKVKHDIQTENEYFTEAIISKDEDMLNQFQEILIKRGRRKKYD